MATETVRATPAIRAKVLADLKSGRIKGVMNLAKEHGISRSSVYRIMKGAATATAPTVAKSAPTPKASKAPRNPLDTDSESDAESDASDVNDNFYYRNDKFAEDLGLVAPTARSAMSKEPQVDPVTEAQLDAMMDRVAGAPGQESPLPAFMEKIMSDAPPPKRLGSLTQAAVLEQVPRALSVDRGDVIQRIVFNLQHFGTLLTGIVGPLEGHPAFIQSLATKETLELTHLLNTLERARSVGTISAGFKQVFYTVAQGVELSSRLVGVKAQGFTDHLRQQDEEITMCLKEIAMNEWERLKELDSPQARLGILFCLTLAQTHTHNQMGEVLATAAAASKAKAAEPVDPKLVAASADL